MKRIKQIAVALCATACAFTTAFADDDFGIESATPTVKISDPINPQPGMIFNAYNPDTYMRWPQLQESIFKLPKQAAVKTQVDKMENFSLEQIGNIHARVGRWEGFLKCKRATTYTFVLSKLGPGGNDWPEVGFSLSINGKLVIPAANKQESCDVNLKVGWNKVDLVCQFFSDQGTKPLTMTFKPKESLSEPRPIGPKDFFHDQKPEEDW